MRTHDSAESFSGKQQTVVTIGTFDGVHVGHRKIIQRLLSSAEGSELESAVLTFFPHPRMVVQEDADIKLINTIDERKELLGQTGLDHLIVHPFTMEFSRLSAEAYVEEILVDKLRAKKVIIGYDHHFGRNRRANIHDLKRYGEQYGFEVEEISKQDIDDVSISSTKIRKALSSGDIERANTYLGHPFILSGKVTRGKGLGRQMNYPTANLEIVEKYKLIPAKGVYVVQSTIGNTLYYGMMSIGTNPTVGGQDLSIETYFFNLDQDLYDKQLEIQVLKRIRDEKNFSGIEELIKAMKADEQFSKSYIKSINA